MFKFINREMELKWLDENCGEGSSFLVIYGRRRVGKTELIKHFLKGKPHIYFLASKKPESKNLSDLQGIMATHLEEELFGKISFDSWEDLFEEFLNRIEGEIAICIDEFPYLLEENEAITSIFQKVWDEILKDKNVMLILCGSSIGMMEDEVLSYKSPLYGRRTGQWKLKPFKFEQLKEFFPNYSFEDRVKFFGFLDGIPQYLNKVQKDKNPEWNLKNKIFRKGEYLYEEAENLLRQELRKPSKYFSILEAIAEGNSRYGEICNRAGLSKSLVSQYLKNLINLHVVRKEFPVTQKKRSRNALYSLSDNYYDFWFKFVYPNKSLIEEDKQEILLKNIREDLRKHNSFVFEQICREAIWNLGKNFNKVGRWWYKDNEIDIMALNEKENEILLGECKWSKNKTGRGVLKKLEENSGKVKWKKKKRREKYILFSKSGFTRKLKNIGGERENIELYDLSRLEELLSDNTEREPFKGQNS